MITRSTYERVNGGKGHGMFGELDDIMLEELEVGRRVAEYLRDEALHRNQPYYLELITGFLGRAFQ